MTSSADTRETLARTARKRVAGSRRRVTSTAPPSPRTPPTSLRDATDHPRRSARPVPNRGEDGAGRGPEGLEAGGLGATETPAPAERHTRRWPAAVAALTALALLVASLVLSTRPALTQQDRQAAVGSARTSLESLLSYSASGFDAHVAEVTPQLTSPFREEFTRVATTDIKPMAVKNGATVLAKVYDAGVMDASATGEAGSTVVVLAFVNQATTTAARKTPQVDQNRVIATMRKVGDRWLISRLEAF